MSTVSDFTPEGLPNLLIRDIPPKAKHPSLEVTRPEIYYGELTRSPAAVNTEEKEFDYPKGDDNVYARYDGRGGVRLSNLFRKFIYGLKFDGTRFFLSGYPTSESRFMFRRHVRSRVKEIAPFLRFEDDPYVVLVDGRLHWVIDAYTASDAYPYSEEYSAVAAGTPLGEVRPFARRREVPYLHRANYVRNSVKAVVDAYDGDVSLYVFEEDDPLIRVWQRIFPSLFRPSEEMPDEMRSHVRYPHGFLLVQGLMYAKYHMTDPAVFYNQEDLWVRATEKYHNNVQPVEPYYIMWQLPESDNPEFVLIQPFTPKNRQVMIGWIAGMCDGENYGRLLSFKFPKEKRVLGPQQVETKIDQDAHLSGQLTLWDQRGSQVIRGNVLAIPVAQTILYVEPIYLQSDTAAYPELRLVAVMHNDRLSYAESFDKAIEGLLEGAEAAPALPGTDVERTSADLVRQASQAFDDYLSAQGEKRFQDAARSLGTLQDTLNELARRQGLADETGEE